MVRRLLLLSGLALPLSGCAWAVRQQTDQAVRDLAAHPFDLAPDAGKTAPEAATNDAPSTPAPARPRDSAPAKTTRRDPDAQGRNAGRVLLATASARTIPIEETALVREAAAPPKAPRDPSAVAAMDSPARPQGRNLPLKDDQLLAAAWTQLTPGDPADGQRKLDLEISPRLPGAEAPRIVLPTEPAAAEREIDRLFPELPPLPAEPKPLPGPGGKPYTLADLQRLAAANSPTLRQAASDVQAAQGNVIQARTYPNPITGYIQDTSAVNNTGGVQAGFVDQPIITGGKMKLGVGATQKDLDNAALALKRARMDLATSVRNAYFTLLVDIETLAVTRALAQFSDEIYRLQTGLLKGTQAAPYEPTALRAQTYLNRLAYKQAIQSYVMDWKALVATLGLPQLPLSEVSGQIDRFIPYYDYDEVRAYVLQHHTDVLTARNGVRRAQYVLKLAQVTGACPNLDVYMALEKDFMNPPHGTYQALALGMPLPLWNQNKGNIIAAQAALIRASKEVHRVEVTLTNNLALAYENYRNNLYAMEYYRRNVLPNLVRYYRGIYARRQVDPNSAFGDLVFAQQNLSTNVQTYLGILQSLWTSVAGVADFLQTDNLYQVGRRQELPRLPDFRQLPLAPWLHGHGASAESPGTDAASIGPGKPGSPGGPSHAGPTVGMTPAPAGSPTGPPVGDGTLKESPQPSPTVPESQPAAGPVSSPPSPGVWPRAGSRSA